MFQLNNRFRDVTFALLIAISGALITACGGGGGDSGPQTGDDPQTGDTTPVQVGTNTRTIAELTGDTFITPLPIFSSGSETETLASGWRYYPWDNYDEFTGFIYQAGGNQLWDFDINDDSEGPSHIFTEYRLVGRDETAFSTDTGMLAFAGYDYWEEGDTALDDANLFALEGEYAAGLGWYSSNDGLRGTVGLATPADSLPTGTAVWRGKALGGFTVGTPEDRTERRSRVQRDSNGLRGGDGMRYFVEGETVRLVSFAEGDWDAQIVLRAYTDERAYWNHLIGETGTATAENDVVGTLYLESDGDLPSAGAYGLQVSGEVDDIGSAGAELGVFATLVSEFYNDQAMTNSHTFGIYGPNAEEVAGDIRLSACSETPTLTAGNFVCSSGDLHYLGVGFVEQEAVSPLSTTPTPVQGDTLAQMLTKLELPTQPTKTSTAEDGLREESYIDLAAFAAAQTKSYEYASFGQWVRLLTNSEGVPSFFGGILDFSPTANQVASLPTSGNATYDLASILYYEPAGSREATGLLTADFVDSSISGKPFRGRPR